MKSTAFRCIGCHVLLNVRKNEEHLHFFPSYMNVTVTLTP